ncbi:UNVERIFIED_CONTAM: hypothetical protein Slati_2614700 [Sesamum latifolium]|uniref:Uncharacterized protein n=1 Tax=Sesamum latifolium TaxID=2727402 RepID=A0AAW2VST6_9LAMI
MNGPATPPPSPRCPPTNPLLRHAAGHLRGDKIAPLCGQPPKQFWATTVRRNLLQAVKLLSPAHKEATARSLLPKGATPFFAAPVAQ